MTPEWISNVVPIIERWLCRLRNRANARAYPTGLKANVSTVTEREGQSKDALDWSLSKVAAVFLAESWFGKRVYL